MPSASANTAHASTIESTVRPGRANARAPIATPNTPRTSSTHHFRVMASNMARPFYLYRHSVKTAAVLSYADSAVVLTCRNRIAPNVSPRKNRAMFNLKRQTARDLFWTLVSVSLMTFAVSVMPAHAQLNTQHVKGTAGLKAGSQPPPHVYVIAPLLYFYNTDTVKDRDGETFGPSADLTSVASAGGLVVVTTKKILGGFYSYQILAPVFVNNRIQGTEIDANPGGGISDSAVTPINLGWHFKRADAMAGYNIFIPTGRYTDGASDNTGYGMWGHELALGTTVYLDAARKYHAATLATFDFQSKKEDSDTKVGNAMNLEGGVGADFLKGGLTAGLAYYASFKLTDDVVDGIPGILIRGKNRVFALGTEVSLALARKGVLYGFLKINYEWETYARTTTQGSEFSVTLTLPIKPIPIPNP